MRARRTQARWATVETREVFAPGSPMGTEFAPGGVSTEVGLLAAGCERIFGLPARQAEVMARVVAGETNGGIRAAMGITPGMLEKHVRRIGERLGTTGQGREGMLRAWYRARLAELEGERGP